MAGTSRVALRLEPLNDRIVPAVSVVQAGTTLTITGTQRANDVEITDDGTPAGLTVTVDGQSYTLTGDAVEHVVINTRAQHDTVSWELTGDYAAGTTRAVEVLLGNGHDTFTAELNHAILAGASLMLVVKGGNGKDTLDVTGAGNVDGALDVGLFGQNGVDALSLAHTGNVTGSVNWTAEGGNGKDGLSLSYAGVLDGTFELNVSGGNGKDAIDADFSVTSGAGSLTGEILGGNGKDDIGLSLTGDGAAALTVDVSIVGGHGKDSITAPDGVTVVDTDKKK